MDLGVGIGLGVEHPVVKSTGVVSFQRASDTRNGIFGASVVSVRSGTHLLSCSSAAVASVRSPAVDTGEGGDHQRDGESENEDRTRQPAVQIAARPAIPIVTLPPIIGLPPSLAELDRLASPAGRPMRDLTSYGALGRPPRSSPSLVTSYSALAPVQGNTLAYTCQVAYAHYMDAMFIDFANSEWYDGQGRLNDRLLKPRWLRAFREKWRDGRERISTGPRLTPHPYFAPRHGPLEGVPDRPGALPDRTLGELLELRRVLRAIIEAVAAREEIPPDLIRRLNGFLEMGHLRYRLRARDGDIALEPVPLVDEGQWLAGAIALSAAEFLAFASRERLKLCANPGCRWVFYDGTKNARRRWCDDALCGNLFRVRRYRSRPRKAAQAD